MLALVRVCRSRRLRGIRRALLHYGRDLTVHSARNMLFLAREVSSPLSAKKSSRFLVLLSSRVSGVPLTLQALLKKVGAIMFFLFSIYLVVNVFSEIKDLKKMDIENWSSYKFKYIKKLYKSIVFYIFFGLLDALIFLYKYFVA